MQINTDLSRRVVKDTAGMEWVASPFETALAYSAEAAASAAKAGRASLKREASYRFIIPHPEQ